MDCTSSDDNSEKSLEWFPGTPQQEKQFREWIEEADEPICMEEVEEWLEANASNLLEGDDGSVDLEQLSNNIARYFQRKISPTAIIRLPGYGYSLDFTWYTTPLWSRELCMIKVIEEITSKPGWFDDVRHAHIAAKWKKEILGLDWSNYLSYADLTPSMADLCIDELKLKADLYEKTGLIPVLDAAACVIKSDKLVPDALKRELSLGRQKLFQSMSDSDKPRDEFTIDLIDPFTCPLMYHRSRILPDRSIDLTNCLEACGKGDILLSPWDPKKRSQRYNMLDPSFQWLPCDVIMDETGKAKINSYINNLHPIEHADMYTTIEKFINLALPALDVLYRWPFEFDHQRIDSHDISYDCKVPEICADKECSCLNIPAEAFEEYKTERPQKEESESTYEEKNDRLLNLKLERNETHVEHLLRKWFDEGEDWCQQVLENRVDPLDKWFNETHPLHFSEPISTRWYHEDHLTASKIHSSAFFSEKYPPKKRDRFQIIVKLTEIHLTPENPEYVCDSWKTDGLLNEHIISTALFCYDSDNVTDGYMYFSTVIDRPDLEGMRRIDKFDAERAYAFKPAEGEFQTIGRVLINTTMAVFYPNIYRHHQGSFSLVDRSRPGYRKILVLHLVDPAIPIISTSNVPPQQSHWWTECKAHNEGLQIIERLPPELRAMVSSYVDFPIDSEKAKKIRNDHRVNRVMLQYRTGYEDRSYETDSNDESQGDDDEDSDDEAQDEGSDSDESNNE
ncbi:hypothetical protein THAR02_04853 [Trichoderma harzianum]|uniref:Uncharacterized protein n=1 Tax=Trichoderma harzianum TaxID=5544 RepID=A0A0F9ZS08_TRIHA|nr:hypothetical protein THAR02_04853 [Trichoderma harzianum]